MMRVMSPQTAEKLLLTAYLLLLPLSMRYALGAIRPRAASLAIVALPMVPNYHYHMGFQDFCISLAGFFVIAGYWLRRRRNFGWRHGAIMTLMLLGLYFIHAVSTIEVLMLLGIISITWYGRGNWERFAREKRIAPEISARVWRVAPLALAMLPVSILILTFIYYHGGNGAALRGGDPLPWNPWPRGWAHRLYHVASWLKGYRYIGLVPAAIWLLLIGAGTLWLLCWRLRGGRAHLWRYTIWGLGGLLSAALAAAVLFLVARDSGAGGALLLTRLPCYVFFPLLLWWAAQPIGARHFRRFRITTAVVATMVLAWMLVLEARDFARINLYLSEFEAAAQQIPPGSTFAPLRFADTTTLHIYAPHDPLAISIDPFQHAGAIGLAERGIIDVGNHWASTDHQSLCWREQFQPCREGGYDTPWNLAAHEKRTGRAVDYIEMWTGGKDHPQLWDKAVLAQLPGRYKLIYTSPRSGYLKLYRRTDDGLAERTPGGQQP
jgi:hypothetical protein